MQHWMEQERHRLERVESAYGSQGPQDAGAHHLSPPVSERRPHRPPCAFLASVASGCLSSTYRLPVLSLREASPVLTFLYSGRAPALHAETSSTSVGRRGPRRAGSSPPVDPPCCLTTPLTGFPSLPRDIVHFICTMHTLDTSPAASGRCFHSAQQYSSLVSRACRLLPL